MMFPRQRMRGSAWTALLLLSLTACATPMDSGATNSFCLIAKPIYWSAKDTDETIKQAKEHNSVGVKLCGWGHRDAK